MYLLGLPRCLWLPQKLRINCLGETLPLPNTRVQKVFVMNMLNINADLIAQVQEGRKEECGLNGMTVDFIKCPS